MAKKMTEKEKRDWEKLYQYVKKDILGYNESQSLSSFQCLRLKGLLTGKFIENHHIEPRSNYSYELVLNTFKFCRPNIERAIATKDFQSETQKFNYIIAIVENNLNDVYIRMKRAEKNNNNVEKVTVEHIGYIGKNYKKRNTIEDRHDDLW